MTKPSADTSAAHTPGPWEAEASGASIYGLGAPVIRSGPGEHVAYLTRGQQGDGWPNAHLIAAAPNMYEALKALLASIDQTDPQQWGCSTVAYSDCQDAIAKAEGRS